LSEEEEEYWDDLFRSMEVNNRLVERLRRRLKFFYDEVSYGVNNWIFE
jgi:hypothetical protein